jgi:hypothetical protein
LEHNNIQSFFNNDVENNKSKNEIISDKNIVTSTEEIRLNDSANNDSSMLILQKDISLTQNCNPI